MGLKVCFVNIICICVRYDNLDIIEDVYGINLRFLFNLVEKYYDDNFVFRLKVSLSDKLFDYEWL